MRHLMGLIVAGGLLLGAAGTSDAQFSLSIGGPGYGYGSGYYSSGYSGYVAGPGVIGATNYGGYPGYAPIYSPGYAYGSGYGGYAYGGAPARYYGGYGYGGRGGFGPSVGSAGGIAERGIDIGDGESGAYPALSRRRPRHFERERSIIRR